MNEKNLEKLFERHDKKVLEGMEEKFQCHIGILAEDFSSQLKGVADSVSGANQRLDSVAEMVAKNTEDIDIIKGSMNLMQSDIGELKEDVSVLKEDVSVLKEDVGVLKEDMSVVKSDISTIKFDLKNKVDLDEFKSLEKRVLFLERKMSHA